MASFIDADQHSLSSSQYPEQFMSNTFVAICNEQMAFCRYHLDLLAELQQAIKRSPVKSRAQIQAVCMALNLSLQAYLNELANTLLRKSGSVGSVSALSKAIAIEGVYAADVQELECLAAQGGSWLNAIEGYFKSSVALNLFAAPAPLDASMIASTRIFLPEPKLEGLRAAYESMNEMIVRQRSNNIEC